VIGIDTSAVGHYLPLVMAAKFSALWFDERLVLGEQY